MGLKTLVGARLKQYRQARGLTQAELGALLGIKKPSVFAIEAGRSLSLERAKQIAALLGCTLDELTREEPEHVSV